LPESSHERCLALQLIFRAVHFFAQIALARYLRFQFVALLLESNGRRHSSSICFHSPLQADYFRLQPRMVWSHKTSTSVKQQTGRDIKRGKKKGYDEKEKYKKNTERTRSCCGMPHDLNYVFSTKLLTFQAERLFLLAVAQQWLHGPPVLWPVRLLPCASPGDR